MNFEQNRNHHERRLSKGNRLFTWIEREIFWSVLDSSGMPVVQYRHGAYQENADFSPR